MPEQMKSINSSNEQPSLFAKDIEREYDRFVRERRNRELKMFRSSNAGRAKYPGSFNRSGRYDDRDTGE